MKVFTVKAEKVEELETLVLANSREAAAYIVNTAIRRKKIGFISGNEDIVITQIHREDVAQQEILDRVYQEIKEYGILTEALSISLSTRILDDIIKQSKAEIDEERLKKTHLELNLE